jgi:hypothetical protein
MNPISTTGRRPLNPSNGTTAKITEAVRIATGLTGACGFESHLHRTCHVSGHRSQVSRDNLRALTAAVDTPTQRAESAI